MVCTHDDDTIMIEAGPGQGTYLVEAQDFVFSGYSFLVLDKWVGQGVLRTEWDPLFPWRGASCGSRSHT